MFDRIASIIENPLQLLYILPAILVSLSVHEWAHAFAAYKLGDDTARNLGRMTINPLKHIHPVGFIMLIIVGFGFAKPVPVNPRNFKHLRRDDIIVSLAGVTTNILMAFLGAGIFTLIVRMANGALNEAIFGFLTYFIIINITLCLFNLIPIPPLDGSHVLFSLFPRSQTLHSVQLFFQRYGFMLLFLLLFWGGFGDFLGTASYAVFKFFLSLFGFPAGVFWL